LDEWKTYFPRSSGEGQVLKYAGRLVTLMRLSSAIESKNICECMLYINYFGSWIYRYLNIYLIDLEYLCFEGKNLKSTIIV